MGLVWWEAQKGGCHDRRDLASGLQSSEVGEGRDRQGRWSEVIDPDV